MSPIISSNCYRAENPTQFFLLDSYTLFKLEKTHIKKGNYDATLCHPVHIFRPRKGGGTERFEKVRQIVADEKGRILHIYGLLGAYDALSVAEFPDNRTAMRAAARIGNLISAQTNTMAAVEGDDFLQLLSEL